MDRKLIGHYFHEGYSSFLQKCQNCAGPSVSDVRVWCFSQSFMIANGIKQDIWRRHCRLWEIIAPVSDILWTKHLIETIIFQWIDNENNHELQLYLLCTITSSWFHCIFSQTFENKSVMSEFPVWPQPNKLPAELNKCALCTLGSLFLRELRGNICFLLTELLIRCN